MPTHHDRISQHGKLPEVVHVGEASKTKTPLDAGLAYGLYKDKKRQAPAHERAITHILVVIVIAVRFMSWRFMIRLLDSSQNARERISLCMFTGYQDPVTERKSPSMKSKKKIDLLLKKHASH